MTGAMLTAFESSFAMSTQVTLTVAPSMFIAMMPAESSNATSHREQNTVHKQRQGKKCYEPGGSGCMADGLIHRTTSQLFMVRPTLSKLSVL